jgi:hypothetical protein
MILKSTKIHTCIKKQAENKLKHHNFIQYIIKAIEFLNQTQIKLRDENNKEESD